MLSLLSRAERLALVMFLGFGYVGFKTDVAWADDEEESDEGEGEGDGGGEGEGEDGEEPDDDKDQPPVTAGGLYTLKTYPVRENSRPLTITQKIVQAKLSLGTDISSKGAFGSGGLSIEGVYGYSDNFMLIGGFTNAYNMKQFGLYFGFEGALVYDVVDIRLAANIHRNAIAQFGLFCNPPATTGERVDDDPTMPTKACGNPGASIDALPSGDFDKGGTKFSLDLGFPFRYAIRPEIAIVALQTLMSIDFNSVAQDFVQVSPASEPGMRPTFTVKPNGAKPDLNPSVGIATNPIAPLSVVLFAQLRIPDFDVSAGGFQVPVTGRVEFSPSQKFDLGLEFTLLNVKPPEGQSPIDNRFLSLFVQGRLGK